MVKTPGQRHQLLFNGAEKQSTFANSLCKICCSNTLWAFVKVVEGVRSTTLVQTPWCTLVTKFREKRGQTRLHRNIVLPERAWARDVTLARRVGSATVRASQGGPRPPVHVSRFAWRRWAQAPTTRCTSLAGRPHRHSPAGPTVPPCHAHLPRSGRRTTAYSLIR
jgi:hypothetical protein